MADLKVEFSFNTTFNQKEFSLVTRALAGHALTEEDEVLAIDLNLRLLRLRVNQVRNYSKSSTQALETAEREAKELEAELLTKKMPTIG